MLGFPNFTRYRRHAAALLAIGLFAMAIQASGGFRRVATDLADGAFYAEVCSATGSAKAQPTSQSGKLPLSHGSQHDCCKLCGASAPLLFAAAALGVPPAPPLVAPFDSYADSPRTLGARIAHPPRGPPVRA